MAATKTTTKASSTNGKSANVWTDEERAAMQASVRERKSSSKRSPEEERAEGEAEVLAKIADMPAPDRAMGERIHALVTETAPDLVPRTYYGMPAYAKDGKVICFFKAASKFKVRYATFEFQPDARLDDGDMWPVSFAVAKLTPDVESRIAALVRKGSN
jgi:uncharacterized protein YdhG (YjbR/CyaY superfamily)